MTAPPPDHGTPRADAPLSDDELVSAVLDGEATAEQVAAVQADPGLAGRLDEFTAIRTALLTDTGTGTDTGTDGAGSRQPVPDELARRRRVTRRRVAGAVGVAAAATLLVVGLLASFRTTAPPDVVATGGADSGSESLVSSTVAPAAITPDSAPAPPGVASDRVVGLAGASAPVDCVQAVGSPDGTWTTTGGTPCGALQLPVVTSEELAGIIDSLLVSDRSVLTTVGVGTGPTGTSCPSRNPLGTVTVTDGTGLVVVVLDEADRLFLLDPATCSPR